MTTFALVHGAWHGAWCWDRLAPELAAAGSRVVAVDLPCEDLGAGCREYAEIILGRLADTSDDDVVLVAHSAGGLTVPLVAAARPVSAMVFVAALLPQPGRSFSDQNAQERVLLGEYQAGVELDGEGRRRWCDADIARRTLYSGCTDADAAWAFARLRAQASTMYAEPSSLAAWPDVPVIDVRGGDDQLVSPGWAARTVPARLGVESIVLPDAGHTLIVSHASQLADILLGRHAECPGAFSS
jgi:pimeloyl-ACP methyl ester carboxylesterase